MFKIKEKIRRLRLLKYRKMNRNKGCSLFCNNCVGGVVLHDYGLRFDTPTVNLFIYPKDYIEMLRNLKYYMECDLTEETCADESYPIGLLGGKIHIYFVHYATFHEAKAAWMKRRARIDYENLFAVLVERDGCSHEDLLAFDALPIKHKVALVHREMPDVKCSFFMRGKAEGDQLRQIIDRDGFLGKRHLDLFDWAGFLVLKK